MLCFIEGNVYFSWSFSPPSTPSFPFTFQCISGLLIRMVNLGLLGLSPFQRLTSKIQKITSPHKLSVSLSSKLIKACGSKVWVSTPSQISVSKPDSCLLTATSLFVDVQSPDLPFSGCLAKGVCHNLYTIRAGLPSTRKRLWNWNHVQTLGVEHVYGWGGIIVVFHTFLNILSVRKKGLLISMCYWKHMHVSHTSYVKKESSDLKVRRRVFLLGQQQFE